MLRDGGVLAFITSQGILNSPKNEQIRMALMQGNNLISAIRLPNNLFTDYAGTEAGSDLIILQKNVRKNGLTLMEERFCTTYTLSDNITNNALFENLNRIVHTSLYRDTDMYGKPAWIYEHEGGVKGIARDLKQMLAADFSERLDTDLYNGQRNDEPQGQTVVAPQTIPPVIQPPQSLQLKREQEIYFSSTQSGNPATEETQLSLFDLFESGTQTAAVAKPAKVPKTVKQTTTKKRRPSPGRQVDLFTSIIRQPDTPPAHANPVTGNKPVEAYKQPVIGDLFSDVDNSTQPEMVSTADAVRQPAIYTGIIRPYHRNDSLALDHGLVGYLKHLDTDKKEAMFHPLQLSSSQKQGLNLISVYATLISIYIRKKQRSKGSIQPEGKP